MQVEIIPSETIAELKALVNDLYPKMIQLAEDYSRMRTKKLLTAREVASITGYDERTIKKKKEEIGYRSEGSTLLFKVDDVNNWIDKYYIRPRAKKGK